MPKGNSTTTTSSSCAQSKLVLNCEVSANSSPEQDLKHIQNSKKFQKWYKELCDNYGSENVEKIEIEYVKRFSSGDIGFIVLDATIKCKGQKVPGVVFVRGESCGILIVLHCEGKRFTLLTKQPRVPVGRDILEIAAGTVDDGEVKGTAVREIEEETGMKIQEQDLVKLSHETLYTSPGGTDEQMTLFLYEKNITKEEMKKLDRVESGLRDHGELIELRVLPIDQNLYTNVRDMKSLLALYMYEQRQCSGDGK